MITLEVAIGMEEKGNDHLSITKYLSDTVFSVYAQSYMITILKIALMILSHGSEISSILSNSSANRPISMVRFI